MKKGRPVALVAGATGGIGRAVAAAFADRYTVWVVGRDESALDALAATLPDAHRWAVDFSNGRGLAEMPDQLSALDLLVHCAGAFAQGAAGDTPVEVWRDLFDVNLFGVVELTRVLLPLVRTARGRIIVVNSTAVAGSPAGRAAYVASKSALGVFASALHQEELENGVRVTSVHPGRVATDMQREVRAVEGGPFEPERYLAPSAVAAAILWVASAPSDTHVTELVVKPTWR